SRPVRSGPWAAPRAPAPCLPGGSLPSRCGRATAAPERLRQRTPCAPEVCNTAARARGSSLRSPGARRYDALALRVAECQGLSQSSMEKEGWMDLQPLGDRLIVEVLEDEEQTVSGIVLPDTAKEKPQRGRVLA